MNLPTQRWRIATPQPQLAEVIAASTGLSPLLSQVLINRGFDTPARAVSFIDPECETLPEPQQAFLDLAKSLDCLEFAIRHQEAIAICGDYDADGMTSTALLIRTLRTLGAQVHYDIPSRMHEGYGINKRMVSDLHAQGVKLILTVDNGIAAYDAIAFAKELGLSVIVTDHHDIPANLPPADAILNPKLIDPASPFATIAGVGVAYMLALELATRFDAREKLAAPLLELFALGTIADLAQLTGVNRRLVKRGLRLLAQSKLCGVQALIDISQIAKDKQQGLKPEAIGFGLGPRINAVGRIGDPSTIIELLTTDDMGVALAQAMQCEQTNKERQKLCQQIETEAIAYIETELKNFRRDRVLVVVRPGWHHGVIGIVASRLVERYGVPVFIGTYEDAEEPSNPATIRGSIRSIPEFNVFASLEFSHDLLSKYGGHPAAGGFSMPAANLEALRERLSKFAHQCLEPHHLKPLIQVDVKADLQDISLTLLEQIDALHPCGIGNPDPVFYTTNVRVISQQACGRKRECLSLELDRGNGQIVKAIAWRWGSYCPVPYRIDIAYKLRANDWQNTNSVQLELVGIKEANAAELEISDLGTVQTPKSLILECKAAPLISLVPQWRELATIDNLISEIPQPALLYGYNRPAHKFLGDVDCDRPKRSYKSIILWSLPPSITHLRWLIALAKPQYVYVGQEMVDVPSSATLCQHLTKLVEQLVEQPKLNLLEIGQQLWVAPCTIVAGLRSLGYVCDDFAPTYSLEAELERLKRWYASPVTKLATYLEAPVAVRQ